MKLNNYTKQAIHKAIMNDVPKVDRFKRREAIQADLVKAMSPAVRKLYKANPSALRTSYMGDLVYDGVSNRSRDVVVGDVSEAAIEKICEPYKAEEDARWQVNQKLKGIIDGCTTLKQLKTLLPEFEKYMPTEEAPTKNLPAVANMVADLTKLGWPKERA